MKYIIILSMLFSSLLSWGQNILFLGATAHLGNGEVIETSAISIKDGKFDLVADATIIRIDPSSFDTIIHVYDQHMYPSFIATNSTLGITEIDAVRATNDYSERGDFKPHIRSQTAFNVGSKIIPTIRTNGILLAQITPQGGLISGTSTIMQLDGWNWEDATLKQDDGIHLNWPKNFVQHGWWAEPGDIEKTDYYTLETTDIVHYFKKAKAYSKNAKKIDVEMEAMKGLFDGSKNLYVHANSVREMKDAILFAEEMNIKNIVIVGGKNANLIADFLVEYNTPVLLDRIHRLPNTADADVNAPYKQAALLHENGVKIGFCYQGNMEAMGQRNLPFSAGTAVSFGLPYEDAIAALTLNIAEMLGIENRVGSITKGKDATFFISKGDALDMRTNNVLHAFIQGGKVNLNNHQKDLFEKYRNR